MSKVLGFITKSNQVLFFLVALLFIVLISIEIISKFSNKYEPPKIELVDNSNPEKEIKKQVYTVEFIEKLKDVHIFELSANTIDTSQNHDNGSMVGMFANAEVSHRFSGRSYLSDNTVNLMFVRENGDQKMLLKKDGLIKRFSSAEFVSKEHSSRLDKNLYLIIDEDTNNNGYLDLEDSVKLFTSTYDGTELTLILSDVGSFSLIGDNELIISQKGDSASFYTFNVAESSLINLNTAIKMSAE